MRKILFIGLALLGMAVQAEDKNKEKTLDQISKEIAEEILTYPDMRAERKAALVSAYFEVKAFEARVKLATGK